MIGYVCKVLTEGCQGRNILSHASNFSNYVAHCNVTIQSNRKTSQKGKTISLLRLAGRS
jgi:hypothetical protein